MTPDQTNTLRAAIDRIIPADDHPSACQAGIDVYLTNELRGDLNCFARTYIEGLDSLNEESRTRFNAPFLELDATAQDALLSEVQLGSVKAQWTVSPSEFFSLLVNHVMEGYYGTASRAVLEMVGFDPLWTVRESAQ
jgi:hypothetical protein